MADHTIPDEDSPPPGPAHPAKPPRDSVTIEGEATEIHESATESPAEAEAPPDAEPETAATHPEPEPEHQPEPSLDDFSAEPVTPPRAADIAPPPRRSPLGWGLLGGAVLGAAAAVGVAWLYDPHAGALQALTDKEAAVESALAGQGQTVKSIDDRLAALEKGKSAAVKADQLDALAARLAKLEGATIKPDTIAALQAEAHAARETAEKALAAVGVAPVASSNAANAADGRVPSLQTDVAALGDRLAKLEAAVSAPRAEGTAPAAPDPRIGKLEADQAKLSGDLGKLEASLGERIGKLEASLGKLEAALSPPKAETRVAPAEAPPKPDAAAQAVAALALEQRLRAGDGFAAEWAALSRLGADAPALAALKPFSDSGAPTASALGAAFAKIAPDALAAAEPASAGGVWDKLADKARKLVRVHPVGEVAGEAPDALVSQIEAALARGQVGAAAATWAKLPEASRNASADWAKSAQARASADAAAKALREGAIGRLAAGKN